MTDNNNCVVCFKIAKIYSIGECDHPVCFECSTRMRVICHQNECPMCRQEMNMVVFTERIRPFRRLKRNYILYDVKYHIAFENHFIQDAYYSLLEYVCNKCYQKPLFETFEILNDHAKKIHDLYCCELCVNFLKIFPKEIRYYTKYELSRHKRFGDTDDKSHRGHPLCEFCDVRYVDRDELYKHLRKEHLYCHICDSEGIQHFYGSYGTLRLHYRKDHYLCEEGDCVKEEFTSVFPTEIDLKAHKTLVHCKNVRNKLAVKQTRTIELDFTLAPRVTKKQNHLQGNNSAVTEERSIDQNISETTNNQNIVTSWDEAFPSLNNSSTYTISKPKFVRGGNKLAITDKNFPVLGSETNIKLNICQNVNPDAGSSCSNPTTSTVPMQKNRNKVNQTEKVNLSDPSNKSLSSALLLTWVEKTKDKKCEIEEKQKQQLPDSKNKQFKSPLMSKKNFPKLLNSVENTDKDTLKINKVPPVPVNSNSIKSKCNYNEVVNNKHVLNNNSNKGNNNNQNTADKNSSKSTIKNSVNNETLDKNNKTHSFLLNVNRKKVKMKPESFVTLNEPVNHVNSLSKPNSNKSVNRTLNYQNNNLTSKTENSKNCILTANNITCDSKISNKCKENQNYELKSKMMDKSESNGRNDESVLEINIRKCKNDKERTIGGTNVNAPEFILQNLSNVNEIPSSHSNEFDHFYDKKCETKVKSEPFSEVNSECIKPINLSKTKNKELHLPPGLDLKKPLPPPGLTYSLQPRISDPLYLDGDIIHAALNNFPNSYLFIYQQPDEFVSRNSKLINKISNSLIKNNENTLDDFKSTSLLFREDRLSASDYYLYCKQSIQTDYFNDVFVDLVVLLPDIIKQQELWTIHQSADTISKADVTICSICYQILKSDDVLSHISKHNLHTTL